MKIVLGCDGAGKPLLDVIASHLKTRQGFEVEDLSIPGDGHEELYAEMAERIALKIADGTYDKGLLFCGTGIGVCMSASKVPGIRATVCHDVYSAGKASTSNNAHIITMGARVVGPELAKTIVDAWLGAEFNPSSHSAANVEAIDAVGQKYNRQNV
ncbi:MAG: RpiB/LacA/LacB family sugar-phosphate isomerase [Candidatus Thiodiazotropha sp.]